MRAAIAAACLVLAARAGLAAPQPAPQPAPQLARQLAPLADHPLMTYHESWWEAESPSGAALSLAAIPAPVDIVALAFAKPDLRYPGGLDLRATGLEYRAPGTAVRDAIVQLRRRNPGVRVLLSIGGAAYTNWDKLDVPSVARLVADLRLDGADIDFEPKDPGCRRGPPCDSDATWRDIVRRLRAALPRPALLSVSGWSVGAYGQGQWVDALPPSPWTGLLVGLLRAPEARLIDLVSIAAYGAGPRFQPDQAFAAYRSLWPGPLLLGIEGPPATGGDPPATAASAERSAQGPGRDGRGGMMVYSWLGRPADKAPPAGLSLVQGACRGLPRRC